MGSESNIRGRIIKILNAARLDAVAVENPCCPGTPDVNFLYGWIELKQMPEWPARGGPLRVPHFSQEQRIWLSRRERRGGKAWVLLRVEKDWLLFSGTVAAVHLGESTREELIAVAIKHWTGLNASEFVTCLTP